MSKKKKKNSLPTTNELAQTIRRDWNGICPVTRVVESRKNKPIKHKKKYMEGAADET
jgi:hypothetical protein